MVVGQAILGLGSAIVKNEGLLTALVLMFIALIVIGFISIAMGWVQFLALAMAIVGLIGAAQTGFKRMAPMLMAFAGIGILIASTALGLSVII